MIQKSDGGYLYATTDMAALLHRVWVERADRVLYVTDLSQAEHFRMVFDAARRAGVQGPADSSSSSSSGGSRSDAVDAARRMQALCGGFAGAEHMAGVTAAEQQQQQSVELVHVGFGLVMGEDGKKLKSRAGDTVKLRDLLDTAVDRARLELETRQQQHADTAGADTGGGDGGRELQAADRRLTPDELATAARAIGKQISDRDDMRCSAFEMCHRPITLIS
jgi:arginyl-tRNA synthetase